MAKKAAKRKMGRPSLPPEKRKRPTMGFRPTVEMRKSLEDAATESGYSLTQEIERRLERSFQTDQAYDGVRQTVISDNHESFGGEVEYNRFRALAQIANLISQPGDQSWLKDRTVFTVVMGAWEQLLMGGIKENQKTSEGLGMGYEAFLRAFQGGQDDPARKLGARIVMEYLGPPDPKPQE